MTQEQQDRIFNLSQTIVKTLNDNHPKPKVIEVSLAMLYIIVRQLELELPDNSIAKTLIAELNSIAKVFVDIINHDAT